MSGLRRCTIKSIISPGDYWMTKYHEGSSEVEELEEVLSREIRSSKFNCVRTEITTDEIVAVEHPNNRNLYLRGKVKRIFIRNGRYTYEVFLIDHGMHIDVDRNKIEIIANSFIRNKEPAAFRVHLYGVLPIQPSEIEILDCGETGFKWEVSKTWVPAALAFVKRKFQEYDQIFLKVLNIANNIVIAKIFLKDSITDCVKSLAELLINSKFAIQKEGINLSCRSKIALSSSDGAVSLNNELLPEELIEIQEIQAKLELVNKWRMDHIVDCSANSELDDSWHDKDSLMMDSHVEQVEEMKPKRPTAKSLMEKLKNRRAMNQGSASLNSNSLYGSSSNVSSRSSELMKILARTSSSRGSDKMIEEKSKINIVVESEKDFEHDDECGFDFEEPMPIKPGVSEKLDPALIDIVKDEGCFRSTEFKIVPAGRNAPDLPKEIKKIKVKNKAPSSIGPPVSDPWIINSDILVEPKDMFRDIPFAKEIQENLEKENFETLLPLQRYAIPSIRREENVVMIAPSQYGKTISYVLPVIDSALDAEDLDECQVYAIIIASSLESVQFVHSMCQLFLNSSTRKKIKILAMDEENLNYVKPSSCHILIVTPNVFISFLKKSEFDLQKLNFLVFDDADNIPNPMPIVELVLNAIGYKLIKKQCAMIVACRHWTVEIYDIIEKVQKKFLYFISTNIELAVFNQIKCSVLRISKNDSKADILLQNLRKALHQKKILIMCRNETEMYDIVDYLKTVANIPLIVHEGLDEGPLLDTEIAWKHPKPNSAPVLLCAFESFNKITIEDTDVLIYYSLPSSFKQFDDNLSCFKRNFKDSSHPKVQKEIVEAESSFIILVDHFNDTFPKILKVVERLDATIPEELLQEYDEFCLNDGHIASNMDNYHKSTLQPKNVSKPASKVQSVSEIYQDQDDLVMFCSNVLETGDCPKRNLCHYRHTFNKNLDAVVLPSKGEIVFQILHVDRANSFWARLIEQEELSTGSMKVVENKSLNIYLQLAKFYKDENNRIKLQSFKLGDICGVKLDSGSFHRAQIIRYSEKNIFQVLVRLLDDVNSDKGNFITIKTDELYKLPTEASSHSPQIVQICISNLRPTSSDSEKKAVTYITDLISKSEVEDVWSGRAVFSINNTILLKDIKVQSIKDLSTDDLVVSEIFVKQYFIENNWAVKDPNHLKNLYKLVENAGIYYNKSSVMGDELLSIEGAEESPRGERKTKAKVEASAGKCKKMETEPLNGNLEVEWANFKEPFTRVEFLRAENTSLIFLRQKKYKKKLAQLESECQAEGEKIKKNNQDGSSFRKGDYCLAKAKDKQKWRRARIETLTFEGVDVLFVDHADFQYVQHKDLVPIPEVFLKKLPIQALECSLVGIKHTSECGIEVLNEIYNFSNSGKEDLIAQKIRDDLKPKIFKDQKKYDVNLLTLKGKSLNKQIINNKLVKALKSEACFVKDSDEIMKEDE